MAKPKLLQFILLLSTLYLPACLVSADQQLDYMVIGGGTKKGNKIMVRDIIFDDKWGVPMGIMACCWGKGSKSAGVHRVKAPKKLNVLWYDFAPEQAFTAQLQLSDKLYHYATNLPPYYIASTGEKVENKGPYLIIAFGETGEVVVWISNANTEKNTTGRIMYEIGRAQATVIKDSR